MLLTRMVNQQIEKNITKIIKNLIKKNMFYPI